ncbi:MAG: cation-transporting P-type ATPase, partial [Oscillospiraceae bacterium]|nr:cation-transporting P-type ATPase [Oscillospiraceae bacterium]
MKYYLESAESVMTSLKTTENGLSPDEAEKRLEQNGKNKLKEAKKISLFARFMSQLKDPMIIILIVAAVISAFTGFFEAKQAGTPFFPTDTIIILVVVLVNAILGVVQESKAEAA